MPGGDGTGPMGQGPRTGRGAGYCSGYNMPGYANPLPGQGFWGRGPGRGGRMGGGGRGRRNWFYATGLTGWQRGCFPFPQQVPPVNPVREFTREQELNVLQTDLQRLERHTEQLRRRIDELTAAETQKADE